jgi:hypothetical protein
MDDGRDAIFKQWLAKDLAKLDATAASDKVQNHIPVTSTDGNYKNEPLPDTGQVETPKDLVGRVVSAVGEVARFMVSYIVADYAY